MAFANHEESQTSQNTPKTIKMSQKYIFFGLSNFHQPQIHNKFLLTGTKPKQWISKMTYFPAFSGDLLSKCSTTISNQFN